MDKEARVATVREIAKNQTLTERLTLIHSIGLPLWLRW